VYCPNDGSGAREAIGEQFALFSLSSGGDLASNTPVKPGSDAVIKSLKTGMFCRSVVAPDGGGLRRPFGSLRWRRHLLPPGSPQEHVPRCLVYLQA
jgi:hypothetical protein